MCATCGCADGSAGFPIPPHRHQHDDGTWHEHGATLTPEHAGGQTVTLEAKVLGRNDALARQNRDWLRRVSSSG